MSKDGRRVRKAAEKFRKNAEKELEQTRRLLHKCEGLAGEAETGGLASQLVERLKQKELQTNGELVWSDQFLAQVRAAADVGKKARRDRGENKKSGKDE